MEPQGALENLFYRAGCLMTRHNLGGSKDLGLRRFREYFGTSPSICAIVWRTLADSNSHPHGAKHLHLLCALLF